MPPSEVEISKAVRTLKDLGALSLHSPEKTETTVVNHLLNEHYQSRQSNSDHIANLKAFQFWASKMPPKFRGDNEARQLECVRHIRPTRQSGIHVDQKEEQDWCRRMGLHSYRLRESHHLADDIYDRLIGLGYFVGAKGVCQIHDAMNKNGKLQHSIPLAKHCF